MSQKPLERRREDLEKVPAGSGGGRPQTFEPAAHHGNTEGHALHARGDAGDRTQRMAVALLSSARHELRSPLQALLGFSELLDSPAYGTLSSAQRTFVEHMRTAGRELAATVDVCTDLANAMVTPTPPASDEQTGVMDALASALSRRIEGSPVELLLDGPVDGALLARCSEAALVRAIELAVSAILPFATQRIEIDVEASATQVCLELQSDRFVPGEELLDVDDALVTGARGRSLLWLKLAALTLAPYRAKLACCVSHRCVRFTLERMPT